VEKGGEGGVAPERKQSCRTALVVRSFQPLVRPASRILCHSTTMLADDVLWNGAGVPTVTGKFTGIYINATQGKIRVTEIILMDFREWIASN